MIIFAHCMFLYAYIYVNCSEKKICPFAFSFFFCCLIGIVATCCSNEDVKTNTEQGAEYRATLESLDWGTDSCYVYGHKTPDVDAVTSALAYAKLMRSLGYKCVAKVSSPVNRETEYVSKKFGFELPALKTSVKPGTRLIVTDHSEYVQCVDDAEDAIILQKIDHHTEGSIKDDDVPFVRRLMVGSTNTIIYACYNELGVPIDDEAAKIMLAGILSDTNNL
ncbi:MAG: DHH family phosphoesterase [Bacteroidaceae bacterium]|nr:DHH family phosphoesterase [Bacteroidaceae bacterium]